jgi:hypothetical protein
MALMTKTNKTGWLLAAAVAAGLGACATDTGATGANGDLDPEDLAPLPGVQVARLAAEGVLDADRAHGSDSIAAPNHAYSAWNRL